MKRLYHKIYTFVLKLMPSTCCSGELACLVWRFLPWPESSTRWFCDRKVCIWGAGKSWRSLSCVWGQSNDYFLWLVWSRGIRIKTGSKQGYPKLCPEWVRRRQSARRTLWSSYIRWRTSQVGNRLAPVQRRPKARRSALPLLQFARNSPYGRSGILCPLLLMAILHIL